MSPSRRSNPRRRTRSLRRARRIFWKFLVWFVIASAVVVSIGRLLAPYADSFRPLLERYLAHQLDQPVRIDRVEASWPRFSPRVDLRGLRIGPDDERLLSVERARLEVRLYNLVRPGRNAFEMAALGVELVLSQNADGRWSWRVDRGGNLAEDWQRGLSAGDLVLRDSAMRIAPHGLAPIQWSVPEAYLRRTGDRLGVRLQAISDGDDASLDVSLALTTSDAGIESLRGHARTDEFAVPGYGGGGTSAASTRPRGRLEAWLEWERGGPVRGHARLDLDALVREDRPASRIVLDANWQGASFRAEVNARRDGSGGFDLADGLAFGRSGSNRAVVADRVDLGWLHAMAQPWFEDRSGWPERLGGRVQGLRLGFDDAGSVHAADGRIEGLSLAADGWGLTGLNVDLGVAGDRMRLGVSGSPVLELPALYAQPLAFDAVDGALTVRRDRIGFRGIGLSHPVLEAAIDGDILIHDEPFVDLIISTPRLTPDDPARWLPRRGLPEMTRGWLNDALLGVVRAEALTTLFGTPGSWPKHAPPGSINSRIAFSGLRLAYARNWPVADGVDGRVEFSGESMRGRAERGRVAGVELRAPRIRIADARNAEVELSLETAGEVAAADLAALAGTLPVDAAQAALDAMSWTGRAEVEVALWFPVRRRDDWRLAGRIDFGGASLRVAPVDVGVDEIRGALPFGRRRFGPARLSASADGQPVQLRLDGALAPRFTMTLAGNLPLAAMAPGAWRAAHSDLLGRLTGRTDVEARIDAPAEGRFGLTLTSDLEGLASTLPAPLAKPAAARWPLRVDIPLADAGTPLRVSLADRVSAAWLASGDYWQLGLGLGGTGADLPMAENFVVEGSVPALEIDRWAALLGDRLAAAGSDGPGRDSGRGAGRTGWMDVDVGDLVVGQQRLGAVDAVLNRDGEYWRLAVSGERVDGAIRLPATAAADVSVVADFTRLHWPPVERTPGGARRPPSRLSPEAMPPLDLVVRDLRWGELDLGELRVTSHRDDEGLQIEQVSSRRDGFELAGSGAWIADPDQPFSRMRLRFSTRNLGDTLTRAGFDIAIQQGRAVIELDGRWPGSPLELSLPRFDGDIGVVITDGVIPEASPGAGRILGLVSLSSIPRRLRLDFTDVFGDGLAFDRVAGGFELSGGVATTDDLRIDAPAAEIRMSGRTDLEARSYDQRLTVRPGVGSALPIIGALAGGPVGAAAGAALQQIIAEPLQGISEVRYAVTGSWENPVIEPVEIRTEPSADDG